MEKMTENEFCNYYAWVVLAKEVLANKKLSPEDKFAAIVKFAVETDYALVDCITGKVFAAWGVK